MKLSQLLARDSKGGSEPDAGYAQLAATDSGAPYLDDLIVRFDSSVNALGQLLALRVSGTSIESGLGGFGAGIDAAGELVVRVSVDQGSAIGDAMAALSRQAGVLSVERDSHVFLDAASNDPLFTGGSLWGMYGNQSSPANAYGSQAAEAWAEGVTGSMRTVIGIIDTGMDYTHPDLYLNVFVNQGEIPGTIRSSLVDVDQDGLITFRDLNNSQNSAFVTDGNNTGYIDAGDLLIDVRWENSVDNDGNGFVDDLFGWDFVENDNDPFDLNSHGTHVAGTIGGQGGNATGVAGINWQIEMMPLRFLDANGSGSGSNAVAAINYYTAMAQHYDGPQDFVGTSNSWGSTGSISSLQNAIVNSAQQGLLFFAAAGNARTNNDSRGYYPSSYSTVGAVGWESVISVASITSTGGLSSFSNYGRNSVDIGAPGSSILSTVPGGYGVKSGTSMATPHVAGAAALIASAFPSMSNADIAQALLQYAAPTSSLATRVSTGGRLDISAVLDGLGYTSTPPFSVVSVNLSDASLKIGETALVTITFSGAVSGLDLGDFSYDTGNGALTGLAVNPSNSSQWTALFTPGTGVTDATNTIALLAGGYTGPQGQTGPAASSANFTIDTLAPQVTAFALPSATLDAGETVTLAITFSEAVAGLTIADFVWDDQVGTLTGLAPGAGNSWNATFTPLPGVTSAGSTISLQSASYTDLAGNAGPGAATSSFQVVIPPDNIPPELLSIALSRSIIAAGQTAVVTFTFSEPVENFAIGDVSYDNGAGTLSGLAVSPSDLRVWTATFTPASGLTDTANTISVADGSFTDFAANPGTGATSANFAVDTAAPAISSFTITPATIGWGDSVTLSVTFNEVVAGLGLDDFTWDHALGTLSGLAQVGATNEWRATFNPAPGVAPTAGDIALDAGSYTDLAGNAGPGGTTPSFAIDTSDAQTEVLGTAGSDTLVGTASSELFYPVPASDVAMGRYTIDTMTGNGGNDRFFLADERGIFYNDGRATNIGLSDYALITDFGAGDSVVLSDIVPYILRQTSYNGGGTLILADGDRNGYYSSYDEVVALLQNVSASSLSVSSEVIGGTSYTIIA